MGLIDKMIARFLKNRLPKHEEWKVTDHIIEIKDVMYNIKISSDDKVDDEEINEEEYVCIRNYADTLIYIPQSKYSKFRDLLYIYNNEMKLINVSNITRHKIYTNAISIVANRITPPVVKIKNTMKCDIEGIHVIVVRIMNLNQEEELYKALISYELLKEKYRLE